MAILTISHQLGTGGADIGMSLAERLGYRYVDQELIQDAVRRYGLAEEKLSHLDESKPTLFERFDAETRHYITILQTTLLEFAEGDNAVLIGRGGQWLLRGIPHVLRVRMVAPFEQRVRQWMKRTAEVTGEMPTQRAATDFVRRDDSERAGRMRYLYEVDIADPSLYEIVINTEKLSYDAAVEMIERVARHPNLATTDAGRQVVAARALASRVQVGLPMHSEARRQRFPVEAQGGVVTREGTPAPGPAVDGRPHRPGGEQVRTRQLEIPPIPPFVA